MSATIKIRGRRELIVVDTHKGRQIKTLRFGDSEGKGKADPRDDLDLGDEWAGTIGQVEWVEIGKEPKKQDFSVIRKKSVPDRVFQVPVGYTLKPDEEFV